VYKRLPLEPLGLHLNPIHLDIVFLKHLLRFFEAKGITEVLRLQNISVLEDVNDGVQPYRC
jgi:hypothetical protein